MATIHPHVGLWPLESVRLGRLVLNPKSPSDDFIDPLENRPDNTGIHQSCLPDFEETRRFSKASKIRPYFCNFLSISYEKQRNGFTTLRASQATTYDLQNSTSWFTHACTQPKTRKFLESACDHGHAVYLVIGLRTVDNGTLVEQATLTKNHGLWWGVPAHRSPRPGCMGRSSVILSVQSAQGSRNDQWSKYNAPGEQIFAVQYRKVTFERFSSKRIKNMNLEPYSRLTCWDWKGLELENGEQGRRLGGNTQWGRYFGNGVRYQQADRTGVKYFPEKVCEAIKNAQEGTSGPPSTDLISDT